MHVEHLQHIIRNPSQIEASDRDGLLEWSRRYPYSGVLSMLLARASAVGGHIDQQSDLLRAAASVPLRQPLFDLLLRTELIEEARHIHRALAQEPEMGLEQTDVLNEGLEPPEMGAVVDSPHPPGLSPDDPMEREALISVIERSIEKDVSEWDDRADQPASQPALENDLTPLRHAVSSPFGAWLTQRAAVIGFGEGGKWASDSTHSGYPESDLIERFIAAKPKIGPLRDVDESVEEMAQSSILEDPTLVTETLARIYAKQGELGKARKAYRTLALKYPAKSTYFASQLKKLDAGDSV